MAAKTALKTTTSTTAPAKSLRARKPKLVPAPANAEEVAISKLAPATTKELGKLSPSDFFLEPRLVAVIEAGTLTLSPFDGANPGNAGMRGPTLAVEVLPGALPAYRLDHTNTMDLRHLLANNVEPTLQQDAHRLQAITVADLERALKASQYEAKELGIKLHNAIVAHDSIVADMQDKLDKMVDERDKLVQEVAGFKTTVTDLRRSLGDARNQATSYSLQLDEANAQFPPLQRQFNEVEARLIERTEELRLLDGKVANDRWHEGRLQAELIRRKRLTFWERVQQVFRPDDFNGSNVDQALHRIRQNMVDQAEADALRGIPSGEGDLGILTHNRIKSKGTV